MEPALDTCSALCFNDAGDQLASVGSWPDYLLTLWRWQEESIVLRSKAFSQVCGSVGVLRGAWGDVMRLAPSSGHVKRGWSGTRRKGAEGQPRVRASSSSTCMRARAPRGPTAGGVHRALLALL